MELKDEAMDVRISTDSEQPRSRRRVTMAANLVTTIIDELCNDTGNEDYFRQFATNHLRQRDCSYFVPSTKMTPDGYRLCQCGAVEPLHIERGIVPYPDPTTKWTPEMHTRERSCTAFGEIEFDGFGSRTARSPYARVDYKTPVSQLFSLLSDVWQLPQPKLVVSVTGGAKSFYMKPRLQNAFKQGLIDVASTSDAWIITGGTATGVMKYVGEAMKEHELSSANLSAGERRVVAIGIAAWGCIENSNSLVDAEDVDGSGCFPAVYSLRDCTEDKVPLDHNHTHFLLVDNGTSGIYGTEIEMRAKLEEHIRTNCAWEGVYTPVVLLVVEGGPNTVQQTRDAIRCHNPVVVIQGSGRAADILALAFKLSRNKHAHGGGETGPAFSQQFDEEMRRRITKSLATAEDQVDIIMGYIYEIMADRSLITIFEINDRNCRDLDKAILSALLKAKKSNPQSQVDLALVWNRADIARQHIFTVENRREWQAVSLDDVMFNALIQDNEDFVSLFVDSGVHLGKFLKVKTLISLYKTSAKDSGNSMALIFGKLHGRIYDRLPCQCLCKRSDVADHPDNTLLPSVGEIISYLLNDKYQQLYDDPKYTLAGCNEATDVARIQRLNSVTQRLHVKFTQDFRAPERELFLWALLFNRRRLARMFWRTCADPVGGALVACRLLKSLAREAAKQEEVDLKAELAEEARYYEKMACGVLSSCYSMNKETAHRLLTRELNNWGLTTLFSLAESAELMDFMQLSCCQTKLNRIWFGHMVDYTQDWKIILAVFLPLFVSFIHFKTDPTFGDAVRRPNSGTPLMDDPADFAAAQKRKRSVVLGVSCRNDVSSGIGTLKAIYAFYTSPVTKFYVHSLSVTIFIALFTFVVLAELSSLTEPRTVQMTMEQVVWVFMITMAMESIREVLRREAKSITFKLINHFSSFWNKLDLVIHISFLVAVVLRLKNRHEADQKVRVIYAFTVMFCYLRMMERFYVSKMIGPKIIMIQRMLKDLLFFICILFVFVLSFGIPMQSLLYPHQPFSIGLLLDAVYTPYWQIFGELLLDRVEGKPTDDCVTNRTMLEADPTLTACPTASWLVRALFAVYMMLTNVLLMNLLIAVFSYTFQLVQENSEKVWRFYRYAIVAQMAASPALPPPLIVVSHMWRVIRRLYQKCCHTRRYYNRTGFKLRISLEENARLTAFEKAGMERYLAQTYKISVEGIDSKVEATGKRLQKVVEDLEDIKEQLIGDPERLSTSSDHRQTARQQRHLDMEGSSVEDGETLSEIKLQLSRQSELLHELIKALAK